MHLELSSMNENITNCLFVLPSYFSGLALLVGAQRRKHKLQEEAHQNSL
jgi:hypothetical protein